MVPLNIDLHYLQIICTLSYIICDSIIKDTAAGGAWNSGWPWWRKSTRFEQFGAQLFSGETNLTNGNFVRKVNVRRFGLQIAQRPLSVQFPTIARNQFHVIQLTTWRELDVTFTKQWELRRLDGQPYAVSGGYANNASSVVSRRATHKYGFNSLQGLTCLQMYVLYY